MAAQLELMVWFSPGFPVGAFAYSHGLEWAFEAGDVNDRAGLQRWLEDCLHHGAGRNDAIVLARSIDAARSADDAQLNEIATLARALASSRERRLESCMQGDAFLAAIDSGWACPRVAAWRDRAEGETPYPVAVAIAAAGRGFDTGDVVECYLTAFIANLVSAAIRLGIVGQTDGQRIMAALLPVIRQVAAEATSAEIADIGGCVFAADIAAIAHETQYTRLFRS